MNEEQPVGLWSQPLEPGPAPLRTSERQVFTLRPYQQEAVSMTLRHLNDHHGKNGLLVLPTGSGKSLVIAELVKELGEPVLVFQPSKEILEQNVAKYRSYGFPCGIYSASAGVKRLHDVTFATIGSVVNKTHLLERFRYVIVDECHLVNSKGGMYESLITTLGVPVIGLTATPYRLGRDIDGYSILKFLTRTRPRIFDTVIYYVQNRRLFDEGHLCKLTYHSIKGFNRQSLQVNTTGSDFTDASVRAAYRASGFEEKVVRVVNRLFEIGRRNALVFTRFVQEAEVVVRNVPGAAIVTAETPDKERERVIRGFKQGWIRCVCNVGILTTGFDYPELEAVVLARPTRSLGLYYQMIGRAMRPHPGKDDALVVDMGGNFELFGRIEDMELSQQGGWHISSKGRQLTNVPFGRKQYFKRP